MDSYDLARMNLQLFGEDENEAVERITDLNEDYPGDGKTFPDGMGQEDLPNAVTVCAGQLVRIADALEELNEMLDGIIDKTDGHLCIKGMIENV